MTGMYAMHYAVSGCPIAAQNRKELEKVNYIISPSYEMVSLSLVYS